MNKQVQQNLKLITNIVVYLIALLCIIFLLPRICAFFMPFIIGWIISCIANPLVLFLDRKLKIKRKAGTVVVIILVIGAVVGIGYLGVLFLVKQLTGFITDVPQMWAELQNDIMHVENLLNRLIGRFFPEWKEIINNIEVVIGDAIKNFAGNMESSGSFEGVGSMVGNIASKIISVIMCILSAYFFIADRDYVSQLADKYMPGSVKEKYDVFVGSIKQAVGGYFKAQFKIEVWIYCLILVGLLLLRVNYAFLIAFCIAALDFLPFFGSGAVFWPWALLEVLAGDYVRAIALMIIYGLCQLVRQLIQPKIMGDSIGMEPIPTLVLLFIGYKVGGVLGMILAVPIGIIVVNMNEAGFFNTPKMSIKLLVRNLNRYRKLDKEDINE